MRKPVGLTSERDPERGAFPKEAPLDHVEQVAGTLLVQHYIPEGLT
jgi:hypothetical protein